MGRLREILQRLRGSRTEDDAGGAVVERDRADLAFGEREPMRPEPTDRDRRFDKEHDRVRVERPRQD